MLDTTWRLLQKYVVSIPTFIIKNVGIPIGFTFRIIEDRFIYKEFFDSFQNAFALKIKDYIHVVGSDQRKALRSFIKSQGIQHLICLRHLLASLGKSPFAYQISNMVTATNKKDLDSLKEIYENEWNQIQDPKQLQKLKRLLKKIGLSFENRSILKNKERWREVSMMKRVEFKMPSCTNQLESTHGYLNSGIPRRNSSWTSIKRLIEAIIKKNRRYQLYFKLNYSYYKQKQLISTNS